MIIHWGRHAKTAKLDKIKIVSREAFYEHFIANPDKGKKGGAYITTASNVELTEAHRYLKTDFRGAAHLRRNNKSHISSWCITIDGDQQTKIKGFCIDPREVILSLRKLNINHIIYTTASHKKNKPKWRLIVFCEFTENRQAEIHHATVIYLYKLLKANGCRLLQEANESFVLSQMWFLPILTEDYRSSFYNDGKDLIPQAPEKTIPVVQAQLSEAQSYKEIIDTIIKGESPLHATIGKYIFGAVKDGRQSAEIIATLKGLTVNYNEGDKRLADRKRDIQRRVLTMKRKFTEETCWQAEKEEDNERTYTRYPDQGGNFERLVQLNMKRMIYPNRPIAVTAARFQISVLGGRVYTGHTGKGLVQTILLTGRSTIGKSFVKKNSIWLFDNIHMNQYAFEFMGAAYYTSVKNFFDDANGRYSLGSIRTESGQADKSSAGDMSRVMMYELEAATESGETGVISSGAQNDKVPELYSPAITTIRESVAEIQNEADILLRTSIAGVEGRRSYVVSDPKKRKPNCNIAETIPKQDREWLAELLQLTINDNRKKWDKPMSKDMWVQWQFEDRKYLETKQLQWLAIENKKHKQGDIYSTTVYGRMIERVPAYAALLAVCENPPNPVITNEQIDVAEKSIVAEMQTHRKQHSTGELSGPWGLLEKKVKGIFSGSMTRHMSRYDKRLHEVASKELESGCIEWTPLSRILQTFEPYRILKEQKDFHRHFQEQAKGWDITLMKGYETKSMFNHQRKTYKRT